MSDKTSKDAFEAWARSILWNLDAIGNRGWNLWKLAWQASRAQALEEAAKACESRVMGDNNREDGEAKRCASAIRNLGSKGGLG